MNSGELELFEKINIHDWYLKLSEDFFCPIDEKLEKTSRKEIESVLGKFNYCYSYSPLSKIYGVITIYDGIEFNCNPEIRYGSVRINFFAKNISSGKLIGSTLHGICREIEIAKGNIDANNILSPRFKTYEELYQILERVFKKYEEFKVAVIESGILNDT